jgi:hypothetical protein
VVADPPEDWPITPLAPRVQRVWVEFLATSDADWATLLAIINKTVGPLISCCLDALREG